MHVVKPGCVILLVILAGAACSTESSVAMSPSSPSPSTVATPGPIVLDGISLMASPSVVTSGDRLTLNWVAPTGRGCSGGGDWVALYKVDDPDQTGAANGHSDLWFQHLCGGTSGSSTLTAPAEPGQYEFRYMAGDAAVARSNPVTVNASAGPRPPLVPTLTIDGGTASTRKIGETFWVVGTGYTPGGSVTRHIDPAVNGSNVITPLTVDRLGNVSWVFLPTCGNFNPRNTVTITAVDDATGRISNPITETVIGTCP
jgi:hypothetical protein